MNAEVKPMATVRPNQMFVQGRIENVSRFDGKYDHIVITPAPDAYSKPSLLRINATTPLGQVGDDCKVMVTFNGWANNYKNSEGVAVKDVKGFFIALE